MGSTWAADKKWWDKYWPDVERIIRRVAGTIVDISPITNTRITLARTTR
jgi:hypothetical protein